MWIDNKKQKFIQIYKIALEINTNPKLRINLDE